MRISNAFKTVGLSVLAVVMCLPMPTVFAAETYDEFPFAPNFVSDGVTVGSDGAIWFAEYENPNYSDTHIVRMTASGVRTAQYDISAQSQGITTGPDGAIWFTEYSTSQFIAKIGRLTTSGSLTEYDLPNNNSLPLKITTGPDGALWFTEHYGNKIGRITTGGIITEYDIPTQNAYAMDITSGPDGALWFTEQGSNKIGRITTAGVVSEYDIPNQNASLISITSGSDGALWFIEYNNDTDKLGRITTAGIVTEYANLIERAGPRGLRTGPDGALWLVMGSGGTDGQSRIARISTNGIVTGKYNTPSYQPEPMNLAFAQNGSVWYSGLYAIGRLTMPVQSQATSLSLTPAFSLPSMSGSTTVTARATLSNGSPAIHASITFTGGSTADAAYYCVTDSTGTCNYTFANRTTGFVTTAVAYVDNNLDGQRQQSEPQKTTTQIWLP